MKRTKNYEVNYCKMCRNGYRISRRIWWMKMFNHIDALPAHLMNYQWSRAQKWYRVRASIESILTSRKTEIVTSAGGRKLQGRLAVVPKAENVGDLITADHTVLSEGCESRHNHRYDVVVQDLATQWLQSDPCKTKTSQETQKSPQKFLEPTTRKQKSQLH